LDGIVQIVDEIEPHRVMLLLSFCACVRAE
jgi:hypothetical protein